MIRPLRWLLSVAIVAAASSSAVRAADDDPRDIIARAIKAHGGADFLGKTATSRGNDACKSAASSHAGDSLSYSWSFQWPSKAQWKAGERYGLCWVPESS